MSREQQELYPVPHVGESRFIPSSIQTTTAIEGLTSQTSIGRAAITLLLLFSVVHAIVLGFLYVPIPPNPDHELYDYMAWTAIERGGLYRDAGDVNMPGEALLHIASMEIFGNHYWSYRMLEYSIFVSFLAALALLSRRYYGNIFAFLIFVLYSIVYTISGYWMTGQRDLLATHACVLAGFMLLRRVEGGGMAWLGASGLALASAVLLKPTYLAFGPILLALIFVLIRPSLMRLVFDTIVLGFVGAAFLGFVAIMGWATDSLNAWHEMTFVYSLNNYVGGVTLASIVGSIYWTFANSWYWFSAMAFVGLVGLIFERRKAPLVVIFAASGTIILSTFAQRKGFVYHFGGLLLVISILCASYLTELIRLAIKLSDLRLRFTLLVFPTLLMLTVLLSNSYREFQPQVAWYIDGSRFGDLLASRRFKDVVESANYARSATKSGETVWTYNAHLMINTLSERRCPTRLVNFALLRFSRASPLEKSWRSEVESIFRENAPEFIVLEAAHPPNHDVYRYLDNIRPDEPASVLKDALDRLYVPDQKFGRFAFFRKDKSKFAKVSDEPGSPTNGKPN
jgi:Dolichyl-phosphate-mannose-protein mannosyltransferase